MKSAYQLDRKMMAALLKWSRAQEEASRAQEEAYRAKLEYDRAAFELNKYLKETETK